MDLLFFIKKINLFEDFYSGCKKLRHSGLPLVIMMYCMMSFFIGSYNNLQELPLKHFCYSRHIPKQMLLPQGWIRNAKKYNR